MVITRTPFRISFFGGGTDYPAWYRKHGGSVLNATINKYCYINCRFLPPFFKYKYLARYFYREEVNNIEDINHPSIRECLKFMKCKEGIEVLHTADIPALSGVGSSSAFTVGLLNSLTALHGRMIGKRNLAQNALYVEQKMIKENVGSQDQIATVFGGFNRIDFRQDDEFIVHPVTLEYTKLNKLQKNLMLFFTGFTRRASDIAAKQIAQIPNKTEELTRMSIMVDEAINILNRDSDDLRDFGLLLHETWKIKRELSNCVTSTKIDEIYECALKTGAVGGKLCGAGGGGMMLLFVPPEKQPDICTKLKGILHIPFRFEDLGTQIIMYSPEDKYENVS